MMTETELQQAILRLLNRWLRDQDWECWEQEFDRVAGSCQVGTEGSRCQI